MQRQPSGRALPPANLDCIDTVEQQQQEQQEQQLLQAEVPLIKVGAGLGARRDRKVKARQEANDSSAARLSPSVTLGRLPMLPLRLIHDFVAGAPADASVPATAGSASVLFLLSRHLSFQFQEALSWKDFFTAETVRNTLDRKECRRLLRNIHKAQLLIRTELKIHEWGVRDYARCHHGINYACAFEDRTPRISADSIEEFVSKHEAVNGVPVVVTGLTKGWPALQKWKLHRLNRQFGGMRWRVGDDDDGYPVNMRMASYLWYTQHIAPYEDNPLYLFDSSFEDSKVCPPATSN